MLEKFKYYANKYEDKNPKFIGRFGSARTRLNDKSDIDKIAELINTGDDINYNNKVLVIFPLYYQSHTYSQETNSSKSFSDDTHSLTPFIKYGSGAFTLFNLINNGENIFNYDYQMVMLNRHALAGTENYLND